MSQTSTSTTNAPAIPGLYLRGSLVGLRPVEEGDLDRCYVWLNDWDVIRFTSSWMPKTIGAERAWLTKDRSHNDDFSFAVVRLSDGLHVGNGGIHQVDWQGRCATMGLIIGDRTAQDRGLGRETEALLLRFAFMRLNLHRVQASVYSNNPRSRHVAELVGLRHEGTRRQRIFRDGKYYDEDVFGILRSEWDAREAASENLA